jgi:hypothetical protein
MSQTTRKWEIINKEYFKKFNLEYIEDIIFTGSIDLAKVKVGQIFDA